MYYFVTTLFVLMCSAANFISLQEIFVYISAFIFILVGVEYKRFRESDFKLLASTCIIYIGYTGLRFLFLNHIPTSHLVSDLHFLIQRLFFSILFCAVLKEKTVFYLTRVIYYLACISLFFYVLQLISGDLVYNIGRAIHLPPRIYGSTGYVNFMIFTYDQGHPHQNDGFMWEPGAYGAMLNIALLLYFLLNKFVLDKRAYVFIIAIMTTLSTTSYVALLVTMLLYYRYNGGKIAKFVIFGIPVLAIAFFQLPFLINKIQFVWQSDQDSLKNIEYLSTFYSENKTMIPLNRFGSVIFLYKTFGYKMIWGISNSYMSLDPVLSNVNISNGDIDFITKFGVIGFVFFMYRFALFLKRFLNNNAEYVFYGILLIFLLAFGEPILIFSTTLTLLFLSHYVKPEEIPDDYEPVINEDGEEEEFDSHYLINTP